MSLLWSSIASAQQAAPEAPNAFVGLVPFIFMFVVIYFLMIRPQVKRQKAHGEFLKGMKRGDSVLTSSGILGKIEGITDKWVTLEVADDVRIRILKTQIASAATQEEAQQ